MIIFDEIKYIEKLYKSKNIEKITSTDLLLLARYLESENKKPKEINDELFSFCEKYIIGFNNITQYNYVTKIINRAKKCGIRSNNEIFITQSELDVISKIDNQDMQKVLFIMICVAKYYKFNQTTKVEIKQSDNLSLSHCSYSDIFKLAKVKYNKNIKNNYIYYYNTNKYLQFFYNGSIKICFCDLNEENAVLKFKCHDNMIYEFEKYLGNDKIKNCEECNNAFKQNNKKQIYCKECSEYQPIGIKVIKCLDCGKNVEVDAKDNKTIRCKECQHEENKRIKREYWHKNKSKN